MTEKEIEDALAKLEYSRFWLNFNVLTLETLMAQSSAFDHSDDKNTEHYRYATFQHYLSSKNQLSDLELDYYLKLAMSDKDPFMAGSATVDLFNKTLMDWQFQKLCDAIGHFGKWTEKIVIQQLSLRTSRSNTLAANHYTKHQE